VLLGTRVCYAVCVRYCLEHNSGPKHSPLGILQENCMSETGPSLNHFPQQIFEEKAKLQQVGPYIYEIEAEHEILEIFQNNITYQNKRIFKFSRTLTDSSLDPESDIILHLNLPKIETMALGKGISFIANSLKILGIIKDIKYLFIRSSVNELLWGREYDLLNMMKKSKLIKYINEDKIDGKFGLKWGFLLQ